MDFSSVPGSEENPDRKGGGKRASRFEPLFEPSNVLQLSQKIAKDGGVMSY
jgi:hypothetical protein